MSRKLKQTIIIIAYVVIFTLLGYLIYRLASNATCFDGKQNGKEDGVDCGKVCNKECIEKPTLKEVQIDEISIIPQQGEEYDVSAKLINLNSGYGFDKIEYEIQLLAREEVVGSRKGTTYILPNENRYLVEVGVIASQKPNSAKIFIKNKEWKTFKDSQKPELFIQNSNFNQPLTENSFFEINFQMVNRSDYDFYQVDLIALVRDYKGEVIAVNKSFLNTVRSREVRDYRFFWPRRFEGQAYEVEVEAYGNVLNSDNLLKHEAN